MLSDLLTKNRDFFIFSWFFTNFCKIVSKSDAFSSQAEVTLPSVSKATAGVVTNHSFVSASWPRVQGEFSLTGAWPYGGTAMRAICRKSSLPSRSRAICSYMGIAQTQSGQS